MNSRPPPKLRRFPAAKQQRMDELLDRNTEGTITPQEKTELRRLVAAAQRLMVANGKRLAAFAESQNGSPQRGAVPVTVWVQPQQVG